MSGDGRDGYRRGVNQCIIELEAEAVLADRAGLVGYGDLLRALANKLRVVRDNT